MTALMYLMVPEFALWQKIQSINYKWKLLQAKIKKLLECKQ
jgi:hypothetical protein